MSHYISLSRVVEFEKPVPVGGPPAAAAAAAAALGGEGVAPSRRSGPGSLPRPAPQSAEHRRAGLVSVGAPFRYGSGRILDGCVVNWAVELLGCEINCNGTVNRTKKAWCWPSEE